ncbi:RNA-directed DNA polymerase, partial [Tanacetum coccineum]
SDHESLKFINGQDKLNHRHAKWVEFIQDFSFVIRHKVGSDNQVVDVLSRRHSLITAMQIRVQGFDSFRGLYCDDSDFREIWSKYANGPFQKFSKLDGMERDVNRLLERCCTCHIAKTHSSNAGLYTPLSVPVAPWEDVSLDFVLEIIKLHGVPKTLTSDRDVKFVSHFWRTLWTRLGSKLQFSSSHHPQTNRQTEVVNRSLGNLLRSKSHFEVVYGWNPIAPLDLVPVLEMRRLSEEGVDQSEQIKELHRARWEVKTARNGPFCVLKKNDNAYKIELPGHYNVSATFNVADLTPYKGNSDDEPDSGSSLLQEGEDDAD